MGKPPSLRVRFIILSFILSMLLLGCSPAGNSTGSGQEPAPENESSAPQSSEQADAAPVIPTPLSTSTEPPPSENPEPVSTPINTNVGISPGTVYDETGLIAGAGGRFTVLDNPAMVPAAEASWLLEDDLILGVVFNGEAQAFPIRQMAYHHIANVDIGGKPYLVTY